MILKVKKGVKNTEYKNGNYQLVDEEPMENEDLNKTIYDNIFVRNVVEQRCRYDKQSVKPSSGLVETFRNEIGREEIFKLLFIR